MDNHQLAVVTNTASALAPKAEEVERTASMMAREYSEATAEITRLVLAVEAQTVRLVEAFSVEGEDYDGTRHNPFRITYCHDGDNYITPDNFEKRLLDKYKRHAWGILVNKLGVKNVMSVKKRREFERQLASGELPDITEDSITGVILGLADDAKDFAAEAAKEVLELLRPRGHFGGRYKTNDSFRVGRRVILCWYVEAAYRGDFRVAHKDQELTAIDGVFHLMDGKGVMREHRGPLVNAINACTGGRGETDYFKFKCFKNRNLHLEFKRLDLVKQLNLLAAGEHVLGADPE